MKRRVSSPAKSAFVAESFVVGLVL